MEQATERLASLIEQAERAFSRLDARIEPLPVKEVESPLPVRTGWGEFGKFLIGLVIQASMLAVAVSGIYFRLEARVTAVEKMAVDNSEQLKTLRSNTDLLGRIDERTKNLEATIQRIEQKQK